VNDGTINPANYATAKDYVVALNDYFRFNLIKKNLNNTNLLSFYLDFNIKQMLVSCRFRGTNCSYNDFVSYYDYYYGTCWRFNTGVSTNGTAVPIMTIGNPGWRDGLQLELYAGSATLQEMYMIERGFRVIVTNRTRQYDLSYADYGVKVSTGQATDIVVKREFTNHLPAPYGPCLSNDITQVDWTRNDVLKFMKANFIDGNYYDNQGKSSWNITLQYSQYVCLKMCYQKLLFSMCACLDLTIVKSQKLVGYYAAMACANSTQIACMYTAKGTLYGSANMLSDCYDKCPIECNEINYELSTHTSLYPTVWYASVMTGNNSAFSTVFSAAFATAGVPNINYTNNYAGLMNSIAHVNVFYENLLYSQIDESPAMT
jgi:hypothetical protein